MLKNILNLEGAQQLSKNEQQLVIGGEDHSIVSTKCHCTGAPPGNGVCCGQTPTCRYTMIPIGNGNHCW